MKCKRFLAGLLALATMCAGSPAIPTVYADDATEIIVGDINGNGRYDIADAVLLSRYVGESDGFDKSLVSVANSDVNKDGLVSWDDVTVILRLIARLPIDNPGTTSGSRCLTDEITPIKVEDEGFQSDSFSAQQYDLALKLLQAATSQDTEGATESEDGYLEENQNVLVSPLSIEMALAMLANGAANDTLTSMEKILCGKDMKVADLNNILYSYRKSLEASDKVTMANAFWFKNDGRKNPLENFLEACLSYYDASVYSAPFDQSTMDDINQFVSDHTKKRITELIKQFPESPRAMLVNALTFDDTWKEEFSDSVTSAFINADGTKSEVSLMRGSVEHHSWFVDDGCKFSAFSKEYDDGRYSFIGLLPNDPKLSMKDFAASFTSEELQNVVNQTVTSEEQYDLFLPKFKKEYGIELFGIMSDMGMNFDDFTNMYKENVSVGKILHKTYIDVNQEGTAAAAATGVGMTDAGLPTVRCDRPFMYMIYDNEADCPLFIGTVDTFAE